MGFGQQRSLSKMKDFFPLVRLQQKIYDTELLPEDLNKEILAKISFFLFEEPTEGDLQWAAERANESALSNEDNEA